MLTWQQKLHLPAAGIKKIFMWENLNSFIFLIQTFVYELVL